MGGLKAGISAMKGGWLAERSSMSREGSSRGAAAKIRVSDTPTRQEEDVLLAGSGTWGEGGSTGAMKTSSLTNDGEGGTATGAALLLLLDCGGGIDPPSYSTCTVAR